MTRALLHYAIVRQPAHGLRVVGLTTEANGRWWGRDVERETTTTGSGREILSRHTTLPEARSRLRVILSLEEQRDAARRVFAHAQARLHRIHDEAFQRALTGATPDPLPVPRILWTDE